MYIVHFHPLQDGTTPLHLADTGGYTTCTCVDLLLSSPVMDVDIQVGPFNECGVMNYGHLWV